MVTNVGIGIRRIVQVLSVVASVASAQNAARRLSLWTWNQQLDPVLLEAIRVEVAHLTVPGFGEVDFEFRSAVSVRGSDFVVNVQFLGNCSAYSQPFNEEPIPLGYVVANGGKIDPTIFVSCRADSSGHSTLYARATAST